MNVSNETAARPGIAQAMKIAQVLRDPKSKARDPEPGTRELEPRTIDRNSVGLSSCDRVLVA